MPAPEGMQRPPAAAASAPVRTDGDAAAALRPPLVDSDALLRGHKAIEIRHNGLLYRLQATRQGKLILTK